MKHDSPAGVDPAPGDNLIPSRRVRRPLRVSLIALSAAVALIVGLITWYFAVYRVEALRARDSQVRGIVCALAGDKKADQRALRVQWKCGPLPATSTTPARHHGHRSVTVRRGARPEHRTVASASPTAASASHAAEPGAARTRVTPTRHSGSQGRSPSPRTPEPTPTGTATPSPLRSLVCALPLPIICEGRHA